jgi:hypothetical protein
MVLGDGAFGEVDQVIMSGTLIKEAQGSLFSLPSQGGCREKAPSVKEEVGLTRPGIGQYLDLKLPVSRTEKNKLWLLSWMPGTHACNPSYSEGRDQEDHGSQPGQANSS